MEDSNTDEFFKTIGKRIAQYRKDLNITQIKLANEIGVSQQLVATYEKGTRHLTITSLFKIAKVLHVRVEDLLGIGNIKSKPGPTPKIQRRLEQIQNLPLEKQKIILELLDSFLQTNIQQKAS
jgi:transcriptional regulator with XRE-family HTH domain